MDKSASLPKMRFGMLTTIGFMSDASQGDDVNILCQCDCGNLTIVEMRDLLGRHVVCCGRHRNANSKSRKPTRLYNVWCGMNQRCSDKKHRAYNNYGGRGIKVCDEWKGRGGFWRFCEWAYSNGYDENAKRGDCSIDRIDNNGDYSPSNCRFASIKIQSNNKRNTLKYEVDGVEKPLSEWCEDYGVEYNWLYYRVKKGDKNIKDIIASAKKEH